MYEVKVDNVSLIDDTLYKYVILWTKDLPDILQNRRSPEFILPNGNITVRDEKTTYVYDAKLNQSTTYKGDYGSLRGILPPDLLVYGHNKQLNLYKAQDHSFFRNLSTHHWSTSKLSACSDNTNDTKSIAVVEYTSDTLDIFKVNKTDYKTKTLTNSAEAFNGIASVINFIIIIGREQDKLLVSDWYGRELGSWKMEDMKLSRQDRIVAIGHAGDNLLHVATGPLDEDIKITQLHLYQILHPEQGH